MDIAQGADFLKNYASTVASDLTRTDFQLLQQIAEMILATKKTGNRIYIAGNGGSAATASHMANDLLKGARRFGREGFRSICLADSTPIVTCLANDFCYDDIYSIMLKTYAEPGDLFISFSGSGNSPNVVNGARTAKEMGLKVIEFGGRDGGKLKQYADVALIAPTNSMEQLEDMHMLYEHALVSLLQQVLDDQFDIEVFRYPERGFPFKAALFDFDGTISLIRQGWQDVMIPYFIDVLCQCPNTTAEDVKPIVREFVDTLTGKQTIYQCIRLAEEVARRGGTALEPLEYKRQYHDRLSEKIKDRIADLKSGRAKPDDYMVPGARRLLNTLSTRGVRLFLASGTDEPFMREEADLLDVTRYFDGGVWGAQDDYKSFSKAMVIKRMIEANGLGGRELIAFGDGYVEIENVKEVGGYTVGLATNEDKKKGVNTWKRGRLTAAGADIIIPDFSDTDRLLRFLDR